MEDAREIRRLIEDELEYRTEVRTVIGDPETSGVMPRDQALQELANDLSSGHGLPRLDFMAFADGDDSRLTDTEIQILTNALEAIRL